MRNKIFNYRVLSFFVLLSLSVTLYLHPPLVLEKFLHGIDDSKYYLRKLLNAELSCDKKVVVVEVDEKSVNRLGRWPWDRKVIGDLIKKLREANIVGLDIVFSETSTKESDEYLARVIAENDNVILGFFFRAEATERISGEALSYLEDCVITDYDAASEVVGLREFPYVETNIPEIASAGLACSFFSTEPDADGLFRRYSVAGIYKGNIYPSLAVQAVRYFLNEDVKLTLDNKGIRSFRLGKARVENADWLRLNFYSDVPHVSAWDVLQENIKPSFFRDKIVIIGITETGIYDLRPTPTSPVTPGVYLHYTAISNILNDEIIRSSKAMDILLILFLLLLFLAISLLKNLRKRVILYILSILGLMVFVNYMFILHNYWVNLSIPVLSAFLSSITLESFAFFKTEVQAKKVRKFFSSYVSPDILEIITNSPDGLELEGEQREITILFSDIRDFTSLSEKLSPRMLVNLLSNFFEPMTEIILNNKGYLDKYIGDAIMAVFNAPVLDGDHADSAANSAIEMLTKLESVNKRLVDKKFPAVNVGIGVNTGLATVGNIGSESRFDYTAIGDAVNLSSRLEGLNKNYGTHIIISEFTKGKLKGDFLIREIDRVRVKGKHLSVRIYELMMENERNREVKTGFESGLTFYFQKDFEAAKKVFLSIYENLGDKASYVFYERCLDYLENPPKKDWEGIYDYKTK